jgi:hypothetical protein
MSETGEDEGWLKALNTSRLYTFEVNDQPLCPHCGAVYDISRHEHYELYDDDDRHECECGSCERPFYVRTYTRHTFSTDEQDDLEPPSIPTEKDTR